MIVGISITKSVSFRQIQQEFANVYHYSLTAASTGPWSDIVAEMVASEKTWHSTDVTFLRAAVWSAGGTQAQNQMLYQTSLTGTGARSLATAMDRERAYLIRWPAGLDSRGKPVYLRKYYHSCGAFNGSNIPTNAELQNTAQIASATRALIESQVSAMNEVGVAEAWQLCSESGRLWQAQPQCHPYLEHHQLGDMWR